MRIPVSIVGNHVFVAGRAGDRSLDLVLETGAGMTLLDREVGGRLGLAIVGSIPGTAAGAAISEMSIAVLPRLEVAGEFVADLSVVLAPLATLQAHAGRRFDGLLGADVLRRFVVEIDYAAGFVELHDPARFAYRGGGAVVPFSIDRNLIVVDAAVVGADGREFPGRFVLDTGAGGPNAIVLAGAFADRQGLESEFAGGVDVVGQGLGGGVAGRLGRVGAFRLGPYEAVQPTALLSRVESGFFAESGIAGVFGNELLRRFRVFLDHPRSRLVLEKNAAFDEPFFMDSSGLTLVAEGAALDRVRVAEVVPGGPAEEAGICAGDRIVTVDGSPVSELPSLARRFLEPGREWTLELDRAGNRSAVRLRTRALI